jgi:hypothetical protein
MTDEFAFDQEDRLECERLLDSQRRFLKEAHEIAAAAPPSDAVAWQAAIEEYRHAIAAFEALLESHPLG